MQLFILRKFYISTLFLHLSSSIVYYLLDGTEKLQLIDLRKANKWNIKKIVIDFLFPYYVEYIGELRREMHNLHI